MHRVALIDHIQQARETLEKLMTYFIGTRRTRPICLPPLSGAKEYDETAKLPASPASKSSGVVIASFQVAESMGFKGQFPQWEHLTIGD